MATKSKRVESERVEGVIISGPRKGELITLNADLRETEPRLTPEEDAALDAAVEAARKLSDTMNSFKTGQAEQSSRQRDSLNQKIDAWTRRIEDLGNRVIRLETQRESDRSLMQSEMELFRIEFERAQLHLFRQSSN